MENILKTLGLAIPMAIGLVTGCAEKQPQTDLRNIGAYVAQNGEGEYIRKLKVGDLEITVDAKLDQDWDAYSIPGRIVIKGPGIRFVEYGFDGFNTKDNHPWASTYEVFHQGGFHYDGVFDANDMGPENAQSANERAKGFLAGIETKIKE